MTDVTKSSDNEKNIPNDVEEGVLIEDKEGVLDASVGTSSNKQSQSYQQDEPNEKKVKTGGLWFISLINFILIILIIAAAYWYYTQIAGSESDQQTLVSSLEQKLEDQSQALSSRLDNINRENQSLSRELSDAKAVQQRDFANLQAGLDANVETSEALTKRLAEMSGRRPSDWLLAEANYLVNMAGRKLYLENDVRTAMTLLSEADGRLVDLNDPSLFPVRALIAGDIQSLKQVNPTSTSSIALALAGMLPKVSELPLDKLQLPEPEEKDLTVSEDPSDWRENLSKTWESLVGDLISIDYADQPLEPYIAERQQWLIEQQLKHAMTQAQSAALNEQVTLYQASIQQAIAMIVENYQLDDPQVSQFLVALQELQNIDFSRNYPNKLESQASLKDIIEQRIEGLFNNNNVQEDDAGNQL